MSQHFIDAQFDLISEWGITKHFSRYSDNCQIVHVDTAVGDGYFASYDFEKISLLKLSGEFNHAQHIESNNTNAGYILYFLLEGNYRFHAQTTLHNETTTTCMYELNAPAFWLFSGISDVPLTAHVPANTAIKALQIHLSDAFVTRLAQQFQSAPASKQGLLAQFLLQAHVSAHLTELHIPYSDALHATYQNAWRLFHIPHPHDEMSLLSLQGATFTFLSDLLSLPYSLIHGDTQGIPSFAIQAKLLLDQFYFENWSTRELAKKVHTNESYLKKQFKRLTGMSINAYRTHIRMKKAKSMLASGMSSQEVASRLGFTNHYYFKKVFSAYPN